MVTQMKHAEKMGTQMKYTDETHREEDTQIKHAGNMDRDMRYTRKMGTEMKHRKDGNTDETKERRAKR